MRAWKASANNRREMVKNAVSMLQRGNVLVCPTDTVYGLLADATSKKAVRKAFLIKGRKEGKPLPIFVKDIAMAKKLAKVSFQQEAVLKKSWPGKITLVLESKGKLPSETGTKEYIGLRIPRYGLLQDILSKAKKPLTGTSANLAGKPSLSDSKDVFSIFQKRKWKPDAVLDAGKLPYSRPSKVIDITTMPPKVLRK